MRCYCIEEEPRGDTVLLKDRAREDSTLESLRQIDGYFTNFLGGNLEYIQEGSVKMLEQANARLRDVIRRIAAGEESRKYTPFLASIYSLWKARYDSADLLKIFAESNECIYEQAIKEEKNAL
jgi:hypothetical protein